MHLGNTAQADIKKAVDLAREISGLTFGVYVGTLPEGRTSAQARLTELPTPESAVLLALDPSSRTIDIVTGPSAHVVLDNRSCEFAVLAFQSCAGAGDIVGGIREALVVLAEHARQPKVYNLEEPY